MLAAQRGGGASEPKAIASPATVVIVAGLSDNDYIPENTDYSNFINYKEITVHREGNNEFDAFLLVSYGAPEQHNDVEPFLCNLFRGKNVPAQRIEAAAQKYHAYAQRTGHYSPLPAECRVLREQIQYAFQSTGKNVKCYAGNLFWQPLLADTLAEMKRDGVKHAVYFITSAFDSYSANRRYDEAIAAGQDGSFTLTKLPLPHRNPLFIKGQANTLLLAAAQAELERFKAGETAEPLVLFSAHSIPKEESAASDYVEQLQAACRRVAETCGIAAWELVFQSRSGSPERWLAPDIRDRIRNIALEGQYRRVIVSPIGFFCENMETVYDLDVEVADLCNEMGLGYVRAQTVGLSPEVVQMVTETAII